MYCSFHPNPTSRTTPSCLPNMASSSVSTVDRVSRINAGEAFQAKLALIDVIVDDRTMVLGEVYVIMDKRNQKKYVGQTVTHRLNHARFRPFGYVRRFASHVSQAKCNSESKPCYELHNAIREDPTSFEVKLVHRCEQDELDTWEKHYVEVLGSAWPNGYNQTIGGRGISLIVMQKENYVPRPVEPLVHVKREHGDAHAPETKSRIGEALKKSFAEHPERKELMSKRTLNQHYEKKFEMGMKHVLNEDNLEFHLAKRKDSVAVLFERTRTTEFVRFHQTKTETIDQTYARALDFLRELVQRQKQRDNASIAPLVDV